jgi:KRAB domain-containing zinc finger protein
MNNRIDKLSTLLNANETHLNVKKIINETSDDNSSCSSKIKVKRVSTPKSKRFKVASYIESTTSSQLSIHSRIHSKQKRFTCDQCPKTFSLNTNLIIHKRIQTGVKQFSCEECQKKFSDPSQLKVHKRIHTGVKPYQCDIC